MVTCVKSCAVHQISRMMYTIRKPSIKFTTKATRRGPTQQIDLEPRYQSSTRDYNSPIEMSSPRPVFNGKKGMGRSSLPHDSPTPPPCIQQEEAVRFVADMWYQAHREYEDCIKRGGEGPVLYQEKKSSSALQGFQAFDLEQWWEKRTLENIQRNG